MTTVGCAGWAAGVVVGLVGAAVLAGDLGLVAVAAGLLLAFFGVAALVVRLDVDVGFFVGVLREDVVTGSPVQLFLILFPIWKQNKSLTEEIPAKVEELLYFLL